MIYKIIHQKRKHTFLNGPRLWCRKRLVGWWLSPGILRAEGTPLPHANQLMTIELCGIEKCAFMSFWGKCGDCRSMVIPPGLPDIHTACLSVEKIVEDIQTFANFALRNEVNGNHIKKHIYGKIRIGA